MSHYTKLATVILRLIAFCITCYMVAVVIYTLIAYASIHESSLLASTVAYILYSLVGIGLLIFSKPIAIALTKKLGD